MDKQLSAFIVRCLNEIKRLIEYNPRPLLEDHYKDGIKNHSINLYDFQ